MLRIATIALSLCLFVACTKKEGGDTKSADPAAKTNDPAKDPAKADEPKKDETAVKKDEPKADMAKKDEPKAEEPKKDDSAGGATGMDPALEAKGLELMKGLADVFAANATDCDKLAAGIEKFTADSKDDLVKITAAEKKLTPEQKKAYDAKQKGAEKEMTDKMTPALTKCSKNKNVEKAFTELTKIVGQ